MNFISERLCIPDVIVIRVRKFAGSGYYALQSEAGLMWNDPDIGIDWTIPADKVLVWDKDAKLSSPRSFTPFTSAA